MTRTISRSTNINITLWAVVFAAMIYTTTFVTNTVLHKMDPAAWICAACFFVFAIHVAAAINWDEHVMGARPTMVTGIAIMIDGYACVMSVVGVDQHDFGYTIIGIVVAASAVIIRTVMEK